jgi:hypothetical protein
MVTAYTNRNTPRHVRFNAMEDPNNDNSESDEFLVTEEKYSIDEVIHNVFGLHGGLTEYTIENDKSVVRNIIHSITHFNTEYIEIYFYEEYTSEYALGLPDELTELNEEVRIVFRQNGVIARTQMSNATLNLNDDDADEKIWRFAERYFNNGDNRYTSDYAQPNSVMVLNIHHAAAVSNEVKILNININFIPNEYITRCYFCEVCDTEYDIHNETEVANHRRCIEHYNATNTEDMTLLNADGAVGSGSGSESGSDSESGSESEWESDFEVEGENVENYTVNDFENPAGTANENENRNFINEINNIPDNNNNFILNRFQVSVNPINS